MNKLTALDWITNRIKSEDLYENRASLGLNKHVQKKFNDVDAVDNVSDYIDLGLPSRTLWCKHNYGVESEEEYGEYCAFGDTRNKDIEIPSIEDFKELLKYCDSKWTEIRGVKGQMLTSKLNGEKIFFPAAGRTISGKDYYISQYGFYWSSSSYASNYGSTLGQCMSFDNSEISSNDLDYKDVRMSLRCIKKLIKESNLGLNKHIQKKFKDIDAIDNINDYVDLGLPSGTLWCEHNYEAEKEYDHGKYLFFSEAVKKLGGLLPTKDDFQELRNNCEYQWTEVNGVEGMRFISKINRNSVFFPASGSSHENFKDIGIDGYYWSSSKCDHSWSPFNSHCMAFDRFTVSPQHWREQFQRISVRTVSKRANTEQKLVKESSLGLNKKVQKKFQKKSIEDTAQTLAHYDPHGFAEMLVTEAKKKLKLKDSSIEVTRLSDKILIDFTLGQTESGCYGIMFEIPTENERNELNLIGRFGMTLFQSVSGVTRGGYLDEWDIDPSDEPISPDDKGLYASCGDFYSISGHYLQAALAYLKELKVRADNNDFWAWRPVYTY